jgi:ubiquinone/menaquinone biosynthesis C-methylase UbiE
MAQAYELDAWKKQNSWYVSLAKSMMKACGLSKVSVGDDWNHWWKQQFDDYRVLPEAMENVVELGCGPYTNMRLISEGRKFGSIVCSDPLAKDYINFKKRWLSRQYHDARITLDSHPIEECPFRDDYFDLVVLVNVLDHVQDAEKCLETAIGILKPGGWFVFGQDLTDEEDAKLTKDDVGHPIKISDAQIDAVLLHRFNASLYKVLPRHEGRNPQGHCGTYCFIGRKLEAPAAGTR